MICAFSLGMTQAKRTVFFGHFARVGQSERNPKYLLSAFMERTYCQR